MLLFHGTAATDEALRSILRGGLRASRCDWAGHLVSEESAFVFLSTSPVAGKGGDPIAFARGWPSRPRHSAEHARAPGYLIVVELPEASPVPIHGAVRNVDVEAYWRARAFTWTIERHALVQSGASYRSCPETTLEVLLDVFALAEDRGASMQELLRPRTLWMAPGLVEGEVRPYELAALGRSYVDIWSRAEKEALVRRAGLRLPDPDGSDYETCYLCFTGNVYSFGYAFDGLPPLRGGDFVIAGQSLGEVIDPASMAANLEILRAWFRSYPAERVARAIGEKPAWGRLQELLPPPRDKVPAPLRGDFLKSGLPEVLREGDVQVMTGAIPAEYIVGALPVTEGSRIREELRPDRERGETLQGKIWAAVHELRRGRRRG